MQHEMTPELKEKARKFFQLSLTSIDQMMSSGSSESSESSEASESSESSEGSETKEDGEGSILKAIFATDPDPNEWAVLSQIGEQVTNLAHKR